MSAQKNLSLLVLLAFGVVTYLPLESSAKRILFYQGFCIGYSHQIPITPLLDHLVEQGHQVTMFSPYKYAGTANVTTVSTDHIRTITTDFQRDMNHLATKLRTYGLKVPTFSIVFLMYGIFKELFEKDKEYMNWVQTSKFDLVILDGAGEESVYAIAHHVWKARVIRFMPWSSVIPWENHFFSIPPEDAYIPFIQGFLPERNQDLGIIKKLINYVHNLIANIAYEHWYLPMTDRLLREHGLAPEDSPPLRQLIPQVTDLVMVTWDTWSHFARPLPPNVVTLAPMVVDRILKTKPLPKDIQDFIGSDDFIYASFGTFVDAKLFPKHLTEALFQGLGALPLKVLLKWDDLERPNVPPNIMLRKFYPQIDVLAHPNIKLYLQHGGMSGFHESIVNGIPTVVVPIIGDMEINAFVGVKYGLGEQLSLGDLTPELVRDTILEVLQNETYKETAQKYQKLSRQDDHNKRATMLKLIDRVLDGQDLGHLKCGNGGKSIWINLSLDVLALFFFLVYGITAVTAYCCYLGCKRLFGKNYEIVASSSRLKND